MDGPSKSIESKCVTWNERRYYCSDTPMNLVDAQRLAAHLGGRLATISSVEEDAFVRKQFEGNYLWVAGWRKPASAIWRDERNRTLAYLPAWAEGQPNLKGGEDFLVYCTIMASGGHRFGLHDSHPEASFLRALIEWGEE